jgi:hypothetical protein
MPQEYYSTKESLLQTGVMQGPSTVTMVDLANASSQLRPIDTLSWKGGWSESPYDFPNTYVNLPLRVLVSDPISTYAIDQNARFVQRYVQR